MTFPDRARTFPASIHRRKSAGQFGMDTVGGGIRIQDEESRFQANVGECSRWIAIMWVLLFIASTPM
jgi:hypothetical protein